MFPVNFVCRVFCLFVCLAIFCQLAKKKVCEFYPQVDRDMKENNFSCLLIGSSQNVESFA